MEQELEFNAVYPSNGCQAVPMEQNPVVATTEGGENTPTTSPPDSMITVLRAFVEQRRTIVLTLWQHRCTKFSWFFFGFINVASFILGIFLPLATIADPYTVSNEVDDRLLARDICYWGYYLNFAFRYVPQIMLNQSRGRSIGFSIDSAVWNIFANTCNLLSTFLVVYYLSPESLETHGNDRDVVFSLLIILQCTFLLAQCILLDGYSIQRPSPMPLATSFVFVMLCIVYLIIFTTGNVKTTTDETMSNWAMVLHFAYICGTIARFYPQIVRNRKYKVFFGYDAAALCMDLTGGCCLVLYVLFSCPGGIFVNNRNAQCDMGRVAVSAMDQIVLGSASALLSAILLGHCFYYKKFIIFNRRSRYARSYAHSPYQRIWRESPTQILSGGDPNLYNGAAGGRSEIEANKWAYEIDDDGIEEPWEIEDDVAATLGVQDEAERERAREMEMEMERAREIEMEREGEEGTETIDGLTQFLSMFSLSLGAESPPPQVAPSPPRVSALNPQERRGEERDTIDSAAN